MKPMRRSELEDAGYRPNGGGTCSNCMRNGDWYITPKGAKLLFLEERGMMYSHHVNDCKQQPYQPGGPPETNGSRTREIQELADASRMLTMKLDALAAKMQKDRF
ncbi:MAG: hypothetical protein HRJ53_12880 [Acidobacteria bacterium Pan2503]|uniref:Uncharacterized protein n=1 Tax=Candidatus Acidiferrum panamense TaxID=2741543 RepID=A0A7V8NRJ2_9BACT|nr:hypothetical protein [Candidatus Acidoferrum panamensis]